jgi:hypothetical protein
LSARRAVGEETVVTDAVKPVRQCVEQETVDELIGRERHHLVRVVMPVIAPAEADLSVGERN